MPNKHAFNIKMIVLNSISTRKVKDNGRPEYSPRATSWAVWNKENDDGDDDAAEDSFVVVFDVVDDGKRSKVHWKAVKPEARQ